MITESDVLAFFDAKCRELAEKSGRDYVTLFFSRTLSVSRTKGISDSITGAWQSYADGDKIRTDHKSLDAAMTETIRAMSPVIRAEEMRKQAHQLLAEAEKLAP